MVPEVHPVTGWRYHYQRWLGWLPIQFCMVCGVWFWAGFPYPSWQAIRSGRFWQWMPWWADYCSKACCDADMDWCETFAATLRGLKTMPNQIIHKLFDVQPLPPGAAVMYPVREPDEEES